MIIDVKSYQETLNMGMCGPASLKIVLGFYGVEKMEREIAKMAGWKRDLGVSDIGIKRAAEKLGFKVEIKNGSNFADINKWLRRKVPVIVNWFTKGRTDYSDSQTADGHYSVVVGLDKKLIYIQDPEIGKTRRMKRDDFMRVWFDFRGKYIKPEELIIRQIIAIYR